LKLSSKEFIVAEIITQSKIRKGVGRERHSEEPGVSWQRLKNRSWNRRSIAGIESKPRTGDLQRREATAVVSLSTALGTRLERMLELAAALPEPHLKSLTDRQKCDHALLFLA
jgi:hypothetical protein